MRSKTLKKKNLVFKIIALVILTAYAIVLLGSLFWGILASFKHTLDFSVYPEKLFPTYAGFQFKNYYTAYMIMHVVIDTAAGGSRYVYMEEMLLNSLIWVFGSAFFNTFTTVLVAYCCSRFSNQLFSKVIYFTTVVAITLPVIGSLPSQMSVVHWMQLYDNPLLIPVLKTSFISSYFLVFYGIFAGVPKSYREAAEIDGAGHWTIFFKIMLPFVSNTIIAVFVLSVIANWNDYSTPMLFLPSFPTVAQGLYDLMNGQSSRSELLNDAVGLAGAYLTAIPTLILFVVFRDRIMTNITMGGLKG